MIARLEGQLVEKRPGQVVLDVGGVGYELQVPLSTYLELPAEGERTRLRVYTHVREEALQLYGFLTEPERIAFGLLIGISKVGPRLALSILSGLPVHELVPSVRQGSISRLRGVPGVGAKTAERILMELRDRISVLESAAHVAETAGGDLEEETVSALVNLGYPRVQAERAVRVARKALTDPGLEDLVREALRVVAG